MWYFKLAADSIFLLIKSCNLIKIRVFMFASPRLWPWPPPLDLHLSAPALNLYFPAPALNLFLPALVLILCLPVLRFTVRVCYSYSVYLYN